MMKRKLKKGASFYSRSKRFVGGKPVPEKLIPHTPKEGETFEAGEKTFEHGEAVPVSLWPEDMSQLEIMTPDIFEPVEESEPEIQEEDVPY